MVLHGKMQSGVVVLDADARVPDGTEVIVLVPASGTAAERMPANEHEQRKAALAELLAMPNENPGDTFSGTDHDQVLYGDFK